MEVKRTVNRAAAQVARKQLRSRVRSLEARVKILEEELREARQHHLRLAELTDIVQELLVPLANRDVAKVDELLSRYTDQLG